MFLERIGHGILSLFGKNEPDKLQQSQINNAILDAECQLLINTIGTYGHEELQHIAASLARIKNEMQKRGLTELKLNGQYAIKLNIDRINIIKE